MEAISRQHNMKTLILGIGNNILRDDGIGPAVIRELEQCCCHPEISFKTTNLSGLLLLDMLTGYDSLIVVDAIQSGAKPGEVRWLRTEDFELRGRTCSQHNVGILQALELGKQLGLYVPADVRIMAIEAYDVTNFGEDLTPEVAGAIPKAIEYIMKQIGLPSGDNRPAGFRHSVSTSRAGRISVHNLESGEYHVENQ
jgi:hydrogenase maturation protease